ncbi:MAG: hypothetical protein ACE15C_17260 [Phycisphaerae bacterium]
MAVIGVRMTSIASLALFAGVLLHAFWATAVLGQGPVGRLAPATAPASRPSPGPLAARYPNDVGIEKDPAVIFADNFDAWPVRAAAAPAGSWDGPIGRGVQVVAGKVVQDGREFPGKNILQLSCFAGGPDTAGIRKLLGDYDNARQGKGPGLEEVFVRYYQRLDDGYTAEPNHGANIGGRDVTRPGSWYVGQANCRDVAARGYFFSGLQPYEFGRGGRMYWGLYSYHMDKRDQWGDDYRPAPNEKPPAEAGRWYCLERHMKLNSVNPLKADGLEELWVDGKLAIRREGLRFRRVPEVRITVLNLEVYYHHALAKYDQTHPVTVSYDNVVIARSYIGPITATKQKTPASAPSR